MKTKFGKLMSWHSLIHTFCPDTINLTLKFFNVTSLCQEQSSHYACQCPTELLLSIRLVQLLRDAKRQH